MKCLFDCSTGPLGAIEVGANDDMLLADRNPLENIVLVANPDKNFIVIMNQWKIKRQLSNNNIQSNKRV
jgi:hypothetical protein